MGERLGRVSGAPAGSTGGGDSSAIKVFQGGAAGGAWAPERRGILSDSGNFPTDLYMVEGLIGLRDAGYALRTPAPEDVLDHITEEVATVMVTEVDYRSGRKHDMPAIIKKAHSVGATVVWDLAHSIGAIPVDVYGPDPAFPVGRS